ncbi:MAG: glycosyl transferase [Bacteroidales bacterium]|nr:glycosyl transferase [Bacteroidales bacterium]
MNKYFLPHSLIVKLMSFVSDETYIKIKWKKWMDYKLNLDNPRTFNEKLQWIKLNDHNPLYTELVDKYRVKQYVTEKVGSEYVIPLLGQWDSVDKIEWEKLPNQFVIKCSHDSGSTVLCKDKSALDIDAAKKKLESSLKRNYYWESREWPYKNVKPRIFAEAYMEDEFGELRDYKWFCFDGEPKAMFVASDRQKNDEETKFDFYDENFNHLPITNGHPNSSTFIEKPKGFDIMKELASKLSKGLPEVRMDFYDVNGKVYFGEFTFFHWGGLMPFEPREWDLKFGDWIKLPNNH